MVSGTFDYIVVGAGSAGCALAYRLAHAPGRSVLVLEAGCWDRSLYLRVPAGRMRLSDRYDWGYPAEPDASRNGNAESWESGKVTGGSSTINGMIWVRGAPEDYNGWAALGCAGWDFDSVLPYFRRAETFEGGADRYRGGDGPQHVSYLHSHHPLTGVFVQAAVAAGFPFNPDFNGATPVGVSYGQVSQRRGLRHSTARAYLRPAAHRRNVTVITRAFARRVILDGSRAVGVEYEHHGRTVTARCDREVIVSAGALGSPKLLMASGIGPAGHLRSAGVAPAVDLPGVGQNLQNHLGISMIHQVDVPTLNREITPWNVVKNGLDLLLRGQGTATAAAGHAIVFGSVNGSRGVDFEASFAPFGRFSSKPNGEGRGRHKLGVDATNAVTLRVGLTHPRSRGEVRLRSCDPAAPPVVRHEMASDPRDLADLAAACGLLREVMATEPMKSHVLVELVPGQDVQTDADWTAVIRRAGGSKHPAGTCAMGVTELSVTDPRLRVRGVDGLRVADLSVTPVIPSGNTSAAAIMIGERGADLVLEDANPPTQFRGGCT